MRTTTQKDWKAVGGSGSVVSQNFQLSECTVQSKSRSNSKSDQDDRWQKCISTMSNLVSRTIDRYLLAKIWHISIWHNGTHQIWHNDTHQKSQIWGVRWKKRCYKKSSSQFLVGAPKSEAHLCHQSEGPTTSSENKREFLVITRITHVMDKRSYFSHRFLNEVSHTGVNLDNPGNWRWVGGVQIELSRWAPDRDKVPEKIKFVTQWFCMSICGCDSCAQNPTVLGPFGPGLQATGPPLDLQVCQTSACPMWQKLKNTLSNFHVCTLALFHSFKI